MRRAQRCLHCRRDSSQIHHEGVGRNATIYKGRSRDTAWLTLTDQDWQTIAPAIDRWLDPGDFTETGEQRTALSKLLSH